MSPRTEKKMIKVYRDPNCKNATMQYRNGIIKCKFDVNKTEFEVEENHVVFVVRDCADLFRTKRTSKATKTTATKSEGE